MLSLLSLEPLRVLLIIERLVLVEIISIIVLSISASFKLLTLSQIVAFNLYSIDMVQFIFLHLRFLIFSFKEWWDVSFWDFMSSMKCLPCCIRIQSLIHLLSQFLSSCKDSFKFSLVCESILILIYVYEISLILFATFDSIIISSGSFTSGFFINFKIKVLFLILARVLSILVG